VARSKESTTREITAYFPMITIFFRNYLNNWTITWSTEKCGAELESFNPRAAKWCLRRRMSVMDSPALRTSPCWHRTSGKRDDSD